MIRRLIHRLILIVGVAVISSSCIAWRFIGHGTEGIDDYKTFPTDTVSRGDQEPFRFAKADGSVLDTLHLAVFNKTPMTLRQMIDTLGSKSSAGMIVVRRDTILFEHYRGEVGPDRHSTIFSISKSITSLLVGMAIDKGYIASVEDPVTKYLPELQGRAPEFERLTIEDLLDMRSGLSFQENYSPNPFSGMARLHYGRNIMGQIRRQTFKEEPGTRFEYSSMATAILGAVLERATERRYADLLSEWIWQPLGMERYALVNLDDKKHRMAKAYGGISTNPRDLARWGRLYLRNGDWEGQQLVSEEWIARSLSSQRAAKNGFYTNSWRSVSNRAVDGEQKSCTTEELSAKMLQIHQTLGVPIDRIVATQNQDRTWTLRIATEHFFALGVFGQVVFVDPEKQIVAVYLGNDRVDNFPAVFQQMARYL